MALLLAARTAMRSLPSRRWLLPCGFSASPLLEILDKDAINKLSLVQLRSAIPKALDVTEHVSGEDYSKLLDLASASNCGSAINSIVLHMQENGADFSAQQTDAALKGAIASNDLDLVLGFLPALDPADSATCRSILALATSHYAVEELTSLLKTWTVSSGYDVTVVEELHYAVATLAATLGAPDSALAALQAAIDQNLALREEVLLCACGAASASNTSRLALQALQMAHAHASFDDDDGQQQRSASEEQGPLFTAAVLSAAVRSCSEVERTHDMLRWMRGATEVDSEVLCAHALPDAVHTLAAEGQPGRAVMVERVAAALQLRVPLPERTVTQVMNGMLRCPAVTNATHASEFFQRAYKYCTDFNSRTLLRVALDICVIDGNAPAAMAVLAHAQQQPPARSRSGKLRDACVDPASMVQSEQYEQAMEACMQHALASRASRDRRGAAVAARCALSSLREQRARGIRMAARGYEAAMATLAAAGQGQAAVELQEQLRADQGAWGTTLVTPLLLRYALAAATEPDCGVPDSAVATLRSLYWVTANEAPPVPLLPSQQAPSAALAEVKQRCSKRRADAVPKVQPGSALGEREWLELLTHAATFGDGVCMLTAWLGMRKDSGRPPSHKARNVFLRGIRRSTDMDTLCERFAEMLALPGGEGKPPKRFAPSPILLTHLLSQSLLTGRHPGAFQSVVAYLMSSPFQLRNPSQLLPSPARAPYSQLQLPALDTLAAAAHGLSQKEKRLSRMVEPRDTASLTADHSGDGEAAAAAAAAEMVSYRRALLTDIATQLVGGTQYAASARFADTARRALSLFPMLQERVPSHCFDSAASAMLSSPAQLEALAHLMLDSRPNLSPALYRALLHAYAHCPHTYPRAFPLATEMVARGLATAESYTLCLRALASHGHAYAALQLFSQLEAEGYLHSDHPQDDAAAPSWGGDWQAVLSSARQVCTAAKPLPASWVALPDGGTSCFHSRVVALEVCSQLFGSAPPDGGASSQFPEAHALASWLAAQMPPPAPPRRRQEKQRGGRSSQR